MKKIGFLFGNEVEFSKSVMNEIANRNIPDLRVEALTVGIIDSYYYSRYAVILDRFSNSVPFYKSAMKFFELNGTPIINGTYNGTIDEEFSYLTMLGKKKINVPRTAIFPSKQLPIGVSGAEMQNLQYPLDWDNMFNKIGFPANVKSNNSNDLFDTYRIYNSQDFYFIYDMSETRTLVLQECIDNAQNLRVLVVGNQKMFVNYELHKAPKDRYSVLDSEPDVAIKHEIDRIIRQINKDYSLDMYVLDVAVKEKIYLLNIGLFATNIDNLILPPTCYEWLVSATANMLIDKAEKNVAKNFNTRGPSITSKTTTAENGGNVNETKVKPARKSKKPKDIPTD